MDPDTVEPDLAPSIDQTMRFWPTSTRPAMHPTIGDRRTARRRAQRVGAVGVAALQAGARAARAST